MILLDYTRLVCFRCLSTYHNYRPQRSCGQGNIFTPVCHSFCSQGGLPQCMLGYHHHPPPPGSRPPPEMRPPGTRHPPRPDMPLLTRHPPGTSPPPEPDPPGKQTPADGLPAAGTHPTGMHSSLQKSFVGNMRSVVVSDNNTNWTRQGLLAAGVVEICTRNNVSSFSLGDVGFTLSFSFSQQQALSNLMLKCYYLQ